MAESPCVQQQLKNDKGSGMPEPHCTRTVLKSCHVGAIPTPGGQGYEELTVLCSEFSQRN